MPFHVMIWPTSTAQQTLRELYAFNLDEQTLRSRFVEPYERAEPITWHGRTLPGGDVSYLHVSETPGPLDEDAVRRAFQEYDAFKTGTDITNVWITQAAGSQRPDANPNAQPATAPGSAELGAARDAVTLRDVFLSHASEDKDSIARPLAHALQTRGYTVWFDEFELTVGDSLSKRIDEGLASSRFGVVILSPAFLGKPWPERELAGLVAKEMVGGERVILPVWHGLDQAAVAAASPPLADLLAANSSDGVPAVAERIAAAINRRRGLETERGRPLPARAVDADDSDEPQTDEDPGWRSIDLRDELVGLLRAHDDIGVQEMLRAERRRFNDGVVLALARAADDLDRVVDLERLGALEAQLWSLVERRLATLLALLDYSPESLDVEVRRLAALADRDVLSRSHAREWHEGVRWPVWVLTYLLGAAAVAECQWAVLRQLWDSTTTTGSRPLAILELGGAERLGEELANARPNMHISSPAKTFWHAAFRGSGSEVIRERYGDLLQRPGVNDAALSLLSFMGDFAWLAGALAGRAGTATEPYWRLAQVELRLATELTRDSSELARLGATLFDSPELTVDQLWNWIGVSRD